MNLKKTCLLFHIRHVNKTYLLCKNRLIFSKYFIRLSKFCRNIEKMDSF